MRPSSVVDLFCGVGGLSHGFVKENFNIIAGIDSDETCKYPYEKNNKAKFVHKDIDDVTIQEIIELYPKGHTRILVGCAPCQPFSKYTNRQSEDDKWKLIYSFAKLLKGVRPEIVSMENVPQLEGHCVFKDFIKTLEDNNYYVSWSVVNCVHYGIPQRRVRLVLLASQLGEIKIIEKTHYPKRYRTVAHAIKGLEPLQAGQTSPKDPLHRARGLSELNMQRIRNTPPGGSWKDWDDELILDCHKKKSGKSYGSIYGRMKWDEPAPTMTTHCCGIGNGRYGHPEQNRAISLREAALFQTFPKYYDFIDPQGNFSSKTLSKHIGNAVPVRLGRVIAKSIRKHLEAYYD